MICEPPSVPSTEDLIALIAVLRFENASLKARIAELERQLGLNSSNSGKPPSKRARVTSPRERSSKKPGGQKGHKGEILRIPAGNVSSSLSDLTVYAGHGYRDGVDSPRCRKQAR
jgi:Family of unknown function (DUF6444)